MFLVVNASVFLYRACPLANPEDLDLGLIRLSAVDTRTDSLIRQGLATSLKESTKINIGQRISWPRRRSHHRDEWCNNHAIGRHEELLRPMPSTKKYMKCKHKGKEKQMKTKKANLGLYPSPASTSFGNYKAFWLFLYLNSFYRLFATVNNVLLIQSLVVMLREGQATAMILDRSCPSDTGWFDLFDRYLPWSGARKRTKTRCA